MWYISMEPSRLFNYIEITKRSKLNNHWNLKRTRWPFLIGMGLFNGVASTSQSLETELKIGLASGHLNSRTLNWDSFMHNMNYAWYNLRHWLMISWRMIEIREAFDNRAIVVWVLINVRTYEHTQNRTEDL